MSSQILDVEKIQKRERDSPQSDQPLKKIKTDKVHIDLALKRRTSTLERTDLIEPVDRNLIASILKSKDVDFISNAYRQRAGGMYKILEKYHKKINKKCGHVEVTLKKPIHGWGRVCPVGMLSLSTMESTIRNTILDDKWIDIDIENCLFNVLKNVCEDNQIECKYINQFIIERDDIINEMVNTRGISRKSVKELFIKIAFGGHYESWAKKYNQMSNHCPPIYSDLKKELYNISLQIKEHNMDIFKLAKKNKPQNALGSMLSLFYQEYELRIMEHIFEYIFRYRSEIVNVGHKKHIMYSKDGFNLSKSLAEKYGIEKLMDELEDYVLDKSGFKIKLSQKSIEKGYDIECKEFVAKVSSDKEAADVIFEHFPHMVYCQGNFLTFDKLTGMYSEDISVLHSVISNLSDHLTTKTEGITYGNTYNLITKPLTFLKAKCRDENWYNQMESTSLGKILFKNGYYDFHQDKFFNDFNPDIWFMHRIHHDYSPVTIEQQEYINNIKQRFFYGPLTEPVGNFYLHNLAKGLSGAQQKRIIFGLGTTNCGKSITTKIFQTSLGGYFGTFSGENFINRETMADEAQINRPFFLLRGKRIIMSNEMKNSKKTTMNGDQIKKYSSGGDSIVGRVHGGTEKSFSPHFLVVLNANSVPPIIPSTPDVMKKIKVIPYTKTFVNLEEKQTDENNRHKKTNNPNNPKIVKLNIETELKMDMNIESEIATITFQKAIVHLLIEAYKMKVEEPLICSEARDDYIDTDMDVECFLDFFKVTGDTKHFVTNNQMDEWITENKLATTNRILFRKVNSVLKEQGNGIQITKGDPKKCSIMGKSVRGWYGVMFL